MRPSNSDDNEYRDDNKAIQYVIKRSLTLNQAIQNRAMKPPMQDEVIQDETMRSPMLE